MTKIIPKALVNTMIKDRSVRTSITKDSFLYFFHFYYAHYVKYETADFQKEIIHNLEKSKVENLYIVAFRGSGKSTMVTTAYPIWAILGKQQKKFCIIFCQTRAQAKQHMMNIRTELEGNDVLKKDLGPFQEESDEWGSFSLVFKKHGARITVASSDQSIRGIRHNEHRPDLIICDDVEDVAFLLTQETGGSGTFFYVVGALNTKDGYVGTDGYFLGDRIAPQNINESQNPRHKNVIVVNYADRERGQAMSEMPSAGKSAYLKLDKENMMWAIVEPDFEGESNL